MNYDYEPLTWWQRVSVVLCVLVLLAAILLAAGTWSW